MDIKEITVSGGELSGSGAFSEVYVMPNGEAIKVCKTANSDAWLWWAIVAMTEPDLPFMPKIRSVHINTYDNTFVAIMEALEDAGGEGMDSEIYDSAQPFLDVCEDICPFLLGNDTSGGAWNWMRSEDGREVLTDPFCYKGWSDLQYDEDDRTRLTALADYLYDNPVEGITFERPRI